MRRHVRSWRKETFERRFESKAAHALSGRRSKLSALRDASLLDHLIGSRQQRFRDGEAERLGGFEVDDELELGRLHNRQVGGFLALVWGSRSQALFHGILHLPSYQFLCST
jgi:hypothetical protein